MAGYLRTNDHLTVMFDNGESITIYPNNANFAKIIDALRRQDYQSISRLASPRAVVEEKIKKVSDRGVRAVELRDGVVYYNGKPTHNTLTNRIISMASEGFDIEPMCKFLANLQNNPSFRAVNELFGFLEKGSLPITEDGYFLAYKNVGSGFFDKYTGRILNKPASMLTEDERQSLPKTVDDVTTEIVDGVTVVSMPRNHVNEDPNKTCEQGLHFCSKSYLSFYAGEHTIVLKINPADVVAIPTDYNETKGRCCRYQVLNELGKDASLEGTFRPSENYQPPDNEEVAETNARPGETENDGPSKADVSTEFVTVFNPDNGVKIQTGEIGALAPYYGLSKSAIRRVARGDRKTAGGFGWRFATLDDLVREPMAQTGDDTPGNITPYLEENDWGDDWEDFDDEY